MFLLILLWWYLNEFQTVISINSYFSLLYYHMNASYVCVMYVIGEIQIHYLNAIALDMYLWISIFLLCSMDTMLIRKN